jgi:hypothetical protein
MEYSGKKRLFSELDYVGNSVHTNIDGPFNIDGELNVTNIILNEDLDLPAGKSFKIDGTSLLKQDGVNFNLENIMDLSMSFSRNYMQ